MSAQIAPAAAPATTMDEQRTEEALTPARSQREGEQEDATTEDTAIEDLDTELATETLTPALSQEEREEETLAPALVDGERGDANAALLAAAERVRSASGLAPGVRQRLADAVAAGGRIDADGRMLVSLDDALQALAESLPSALRLSAGDVQRPEHPGGSAFFRTTPDGELSDDEAEAIARGQLARSGLLRGQRVRVAQD